MKKQSCSCEWSNERLSESLPVLYEAPPVGAAAVAAVEEAVKVDDKVVPWVRLTRDPQKYNQAFATAQKIGTVDSAKRAYEVLREHLERQDQEVCIVMLLDVSLHVRHISEITRGERDRVNVSVPDVLRIALVGGASGIILAHNHPSGLVKPSGADKELTQAMKKACEAVRILFMDHVIVGMGQYYSFMENNLL